MLAAIFDAVNATLMDLLPQTKFGKTGSDLFAADAVPPRVVWVPANEGFDANVAQGGDGISNPRPLWRRMANVEVHIWGEDDDAVEVLLNTVISTLHDIVGGAGYVPMGGDWLATEQAQKAGSAYVLRLTIFIPITHMPDSTSTMGPFQLQPSINSPAGA